MSFQIVSKVKHRLRRFINQSHRYDYPVAEVLDCALGSPIALEPVGRTVFDPNIKRNGSILNIVYSDRDHGSIVEASSVDGLTWTGFHTLLGGSGGSSAWDDVVNRASLVEREGHQYLWFTGQNEISSSIGLAVTDRQGQFRKIQEQPVLTPKGTEFAAYMNPCVHWDDDTSRWRMWFSAGEQYEPDVILHASSSDGIRWELADTPIFSKGVDGYDSCKVGACDIVRVPWQPGFFMFYIGYQNIDVARICVAWSEDGLHSWKRFDLNPLISPMKGTWACDAVYKPSVLVPCSPNEATHVWFSGRRAGDERIGHVSIGCSKILFDLGNYR